MKLCKTIKINGKLSESSILYEMVLSEPEKKTEQANKHNKKYIDTWLETNYISLWQKFERYGDKITRRGYTKCDILHESILRLYISKTNYQNQADADRQLNKYFHIYSDETADPQ